MYYWCYGKTTFPGCVMVARQTLDLLVGVQILPGEQSFNKPDKLTFKNQFFISQLNEDLNRSRGPEDPS